MWTPNLNIIRLIRMNQTFTNQRLADLGLSSGLYYFVLELLTQDRMTMSDLSKAVGVDNGHCSRAIDRLVKLGYVSRSRDRSDRRSTKVTLTDTGRAAASQVTDVVREWVEIIHRGIPANEIAIANSVIDHYYANASAQLEPEGD